MKMIAALFVMGALVVTGVTGISATQAQPRECRTVETIEAEAVTQDFKLLYHVGGDAVEAFKDYLVARGVVSPGARSGMNFDEVQFYRSDKVRHYVAVVYKNGCAIGMFAEVRTAVIDAFFENAGPVVDD